MERLTQKDEQGNWCLKGLPWQELHVGTPITRAMYERVYGALCKLLCYEETGLTPERIEALNWLESTETTHDLLAYQTELRKYQWIPVTERLPEDGTNPATQDAYVYPVTVDFGNVRDVRYYSFCKGHWYNSGPNPLDGIVIAWQPRPEPYQNH